MILCSVLAAGASSQRPTEHTNGTVDLLPQATVLAESLIDEAHEGLAAAEFQAKGKDC